MFQQLHGATALNKKQNKKGFRNEKRKYRKEMSELCWV